MGKALRKAHKRLDARKNDRIATIERLKANSRLKNPEGAYRMPGSMKPK